MSRIKMSKKLIQLLICFLLFTACNNSTKKENTSPTSNDKIVTLNKSVSEPIKKDSATLAFIKAKPEYVALGDKEKLPDHIMIYYSNMMEFLYVKNMDTNNYYIDTTGIRDDGVNISIPLFHFNGFIVERELEEENKKTALERKKNGQGPTFRSITGNLSGKDGTLTIDKNTKMVLEFGKWQ